MLDKPDGGTHRATTLSVEDDPPVNAISDAIPGGRGADIDMPATPEKVWRACTSQAR